MGIFKKGEKMNLEIFKNSGYEIRGGLVDGEPYFVLADVCKALELSNPSMVAKSLEEDDLSSTEVIDSMQRKQSAITVNESGLYQCIFQSRKPEAKQFKKWVTSEVLPSIRKNGSYGALKTNNPVLNALIETQIQVDAQSKALEAISGKVEAIEAKQQEAEKALLEIEPANTLSPAKPLRGRINEIVRMYCTTKSVPFNTAWKKLYQEVYYRCHVDLKRRATNGKSKLDVAEELEILPDLYSIASEIFIKKAA